MITCSVQTGRLWEQESVGTRERPVLVALVILRTCVREDCKRWAEGFANFVLRYNTV